MEGLSKLMERELIERAYGLGNFVPQKVENDVVVSHLHFVDDSIIFGEANKDNVNILESVLRCFE